MSFRFEFVDGLRIVMLHGASAPPATAWQGWLGQIRIKDVTRLGLLVFTGGGAPGPVQRRELDQVVQGRHFAQAVVHRSAAVKGIATAMSWFTPGAKTFDPDAWPSAALHAGFQLNELLSIATAVRRLHAEMSDRIPWLENALARASVRVP